LLIKGETTESPWPATCWETAA